MPVEPRIAPLPPAERSADADALLESAGRPLNIYATLVRHPGLFRRWLPFGGKLLAGRLPARDRELLILRTAWRCGSDYEWHHHDHAGREAGLTGDEIERVRTGPDADGWVPFDAALLRAADELHDDNCIGDATWATLASRYDERQLIEVPMVVGHYHMVAFTLRSLGVEVDRDDDSDGAAP